MGSYSESIVRCPIDFFELRRTRNDRHVEAAGWNPTLDLTRVEQIGGELQIDSRFQRGRQPLPRAALVVDDESVEPPSFFAQIDSIDLSAHDESASIGKRQLQRRLALVAPAHAEALLPRKDSIRRVFQASELHLEEAIESPACRAPSKPRGVVEMEALVLGKRSELLEDASQTRGRFPRIGRIGEEFLERRMRQRSGLQRSHARFGTWHETENAFCKALVRTRRELLQPADAAHDLASRVQLVEQQFRQHSRGGRTQRGATAIELGFRFRQCSGP